jgi:hypothetical protein
MMSHIRYIFYQFILLSTLFSFNIIIDRYISRPFTTVDFIAICIGLPLLMIGFSLIWNVFKRFNSIRLFTRILLLVFTFILTILIVGIVEHYVP